MDKIGLVSPKSRLAQLARRGAWRRSTLVGLPAIIRPSFTLGGTGGGIAYNLEEFEEIVRGGLRASPTHEVLIEESVLGWKEYEMEVVRDRADNCIIVCSIENIDPMGVHTGDSVTVAPALTLTDKEYQLMRNASIAVLREIGVDTGGSNVQFAVNPADGRLVVIEMNPRVSRSSALASKATGFPIAKVAAKLAVGYTLDELENEITGVTPGLVRADDRLCRHQDAALHLREIPGRRAAADHLDEIGRRGDGDRPQLRRIGAEGAALAGDRARPASTRSRSTGVESGGKDAVTRGAGAADARPAAGDRPGLPPRPHHRRDPRRLQIRAVVPRADPARSSRPRSGCARDGLPADATGAPAAEADGLFRRAAGRARRASTRPRSPSARAQLGVQPVYKRIDTCAAEFAVADALHVFDLRGRRRVAAPECEAEPTDREKVVILGGGPNRIGQGIEFDYCCVHAAYASREAGIETIMVNCNPETVSTDYDTSDRLYFEPLTAEDVIEIVRVEQRARHGARASSCSSAARRR